MGINMPKNNDINSYRKAIYSGTFDPITNHLSYRETVADAEKIMADFRKRFAKASIHNLTQSDDQGRSKKCSCTEQCSSI